MGRIVARKLLSYFCQGRKKFYEDKGEFSGNIWIWETEG